MEWVLDPDRGRSKPSTMELESVHALHGLAEVISGEDPAVAGQYFRDLISTMMRVVAEPLPPNARVNGRTHREVQNLWVDAHDDQEQHRRG